MTEIMLEHAPKAWPVKRLGQLFRERKEKVNDRDFPPLSVTKLGILPQLETAAKSDDSDNRKGVRAGDFVINSRSDRKGSGGLSELDGSVSLINIVLEPRDLIYPRFAHHLLRSPAFQEEFYRWGHGIVADLWTTRYTEMKNILLAIPDREIQKDIADFLDCETDRIDQLIEKKKRLVELLKESWSSKVSTFLNFSSHPTYRLKHLIEYGTSISYGIVQPGDPVADGIPFIQTANLVQGNLQREKLPKTLPEIAAKHPRSKLKPGDVILGIRASIGKSVVVSKELEGVNLSRGIAKISPSKSVYPDFLCLVLESIETAHFWGKVQQGTTFREISIEAVRELPVPLPDLEVQRDICRQAANSRVLSDKLIASVEDSIERLYEFRAALITAAVTGQIDVTTWEEQAQTDRRLDQIEEEMSVREVRA